MHDIRKPIRREIEKENDSYSIVTHFQQAEKQYSTTLRTKINYHFEQISSIEVVICKSTSSLLA
jgi:hypothetical protein